MIKGSIQEEGLTLIDVYVPNIGAHNYIFKNISALLNRYGIYGIVGPSGCGKSTLFDILTGLYKVDSGDIYINGKDIKSYSYLFYGKQLV